MKSGPRSDVFLIQRERPALSTQIADGVVKFVVNGRLILDSAVLKYQVTVAVFYNFSILGLGCKILESKSRHVALKP